jgi:hypothetical protein
MRGVTASPSALQVVGIRLKAGVTAGPSLLLASLVVADHPPSAFGSFGWSANEGQTVKKS